MERINTYIETIMVPCKSRITMPVGIYYDGKYSIARIFKGSRLFDLLETGMLVKIYFVNLARVFYDSLRKKLDDELVQSSKCYSIPYLEQYSETLEVIEIDMDKDYKLLRMRPLNIVSFLDKINEKGYSRADGCLIEIMVYYTKLRAGVISMDDYCKIYDICKWGVLKASSNAIYRKILEDLKC